MSIIATNFKILRKIKNVSQEVAADELQIPRSRFASYEEGRAEPPYAMLLKISNYYQVSIDALLRGDFSKTDPDNLLKWSNFPDSDSDNILIGLTDRISALSET